MKHPLLLAVFKAVEFLLKVFCCAIVFAGYNSSVFLKFVHRNWTLLIWHVRCSALGFVESHQVSLSVVCPDVMLVCHPLRSSSPPLVKVLSDIVALIPYCVSWTSSL